MSFMNLTIRARLVLLLAFVNTLLVLAAGYSWYAIGRLNQQLENTISVQDRIEATADLSRRAQIDFKVQVQEWKNVLIRGNDGALFERHLKAFKERSTAVRVHLTALNAQARDLGLAAGFADKALAEHDELDKRYLDAIKTYRPEDPHSSDAVDKMVRGIDRGATDRIDELVKTVRLHGDQLAAEATRSASTEKSILVAGLLSLALFAVCVSLVAGWLTIASITRRLDRATEVARAVASGDLTAQIDPGRKDELGKLLYSLKDMNQSLSGIVGTVREAAEKVSTASAQISAGNEDLSTRTEEQASSLEETASSIEEMTAAVGQNAQNAGQANEVAASAASVAKRGGVAVDQMVRMMEGIQSSSRKIEEIIGVIESIAFQTNILALNAAVEAARAGDQGRGFAVVAGEVRSLAQRSAEAAKEIKALITDSVGQVNTGARLADDAGKTMTEVVESVNRVSSIIGAIASATHQQSSGITQVNIAVGELDKVTQQNAALVEESTAASEQLMGLAREMAEAVSVFRISPQAQAPALAPPAAAKAISAPASRAKGSSLTSAARARAQVLLGKERIEEEWKQF